LVRKFQLPVDQPYDTPHTANCIRPTRCGVWLGGEELNYQL